ncbi:MAG: hypothetical protein LBR39_07370, partial [Coriobacteriales bacterium]|nr:hypothetical protein [Coriobacteriales bacterium]
DLGIDLLDRGRSGISLTEGGRLFFEAAMDIVERYDAMRAEITELKARRILRIGGHLEDSDIAALVSMATTIARKSYHTATVLDRNLRRSSLDQLLEDEVDVCIAYIVPDRLNAAGLTHRPLLSIPLVAITDAKNPLANRESLSIEDLHGETLLKYVSTRTSEAFEQIEQTCQRHGFTPKVRQVVSQEDAEFFNTPLRDSVLLWKKTQREIGYLLETGHRAVVPIIGDDACLVASVIYKAENAAELEGLLRSIDEAIDLLNKRRTRRTGSDTA